MNVGFVETMRGTLKAEDGSETKIEFEVHAHADHLRQFLKDRHTSLKGIMRAGKYGAAVPATGSLVVDIPRALTYCVEFGQYVLEGRKTPRFFAPVKSMTAMEVVLKTREGDTVARGQMFFDVRELGTFVASWLPFNAKPRLALDVKRRLLEREAMAK